VGTPPSPEKTRGETEKKAPPMQTWARETNELEKVFAGGYLVFSTKRARRQPDLQKEKSKIEKSKAPSRKGRRSKKTAWGWGGVVGKRKKMTISGVGRKGGGGEGAGRGRHRK